MLSNRRFTQVIRDLMRMGYVACATRTKNEITEYCYVVRIPVKHLVNIDEPPITEDLDDIEKLEALHDPAPLVEDKKRKPHGKQLWDQFVEKCDPRLNPIAAQKAFNALKIVEKAQAVAAIKTYSEIWASAQTKNRRYFPKLDNWLSRREFLFGDSYWRERAGFTLRASGGVPDGVNYAEILEPKIQEI